ncbi:MAG: hypothetical protein WCH09_05615 [Bacteroidota bacterium]
MSDMAKQARAAMKAKASKMTTADPHQKVDSSTWTPPEPLNTEVKTGLRPISRRAFKSGGKVMGVKGKVNLGKSTRGGNKPLTPDNLANKDVKAANEDRAGIKHVGALKTGGRAKRLSGGPLLPPKPNPSDFHDENAVPNPNRNRVLPRTPESHYKDAPRSMPNPEDSYKNAPENQDVSPEMERRMQGIVDRDAAANRSYEASQTAKRNYEITGQKRGGKVAKCWGGKARAKKMLGGPMDPANPAGVQDKMMKFGQDVVTPGLKKGGAAKHDDVKQDMALIKKMVKPEARKARKEGGGVFSGPGYPGKIPGVTGGRIARATGGKTKGKGKTNINIVIAAGKPAGQGMMNPGDIGPTPPPGMDQGAGGRPVPIPSMPLGGGGAGAAPMPMPIPMPMPMGGAGGGQPPMARKAGGRITKVASSYKDMEAGSGGGEGRLQKTDIAKKHKDAPAFKKGGKVYRSYKDMDAGAGSGMGRLEKTEIQAHKG